MDKKLLVSDYDDTFKTTPVPFEKNIKSVKSFRSKGNIFMIATARTYESIKEEVDKYKIEYDYLSCLDGAQLYDKDGKLLDATFIDEINNAAGTNPVVVDEVPIMLLKRGLPIAN